MRKKILVSMGTIAILLMTPVVVVSCGTKAEEEKDFKIYSDNLDSLYRILKWGDSIDEENYIISQGEKVNFYSGTSSQRYYKYVTNGLPSAGTIIFKNNVFDFKWNMNIGQKPKVMLDVVNNVGNNVVSKLYKNKWLDISILNTFDKKIIWDNYIKTTRKSSDIVGYKILKNDDDFKWDILIHYIDGATFKVTFSLLSNDNKIIQLITEPTTKSKWNQTTILNLNKLAKKSSNLDSYNEIDNFLLTTKTRYVEFIFEAQKTKIELYKFFDQLTDIYLKIKWDKVKRKSTMNINDLNPNIEWQKIVQNWLKS